MRSQPQQDFTAWMGDDWSRWLGNLPKLWDAEGRANVPWLLPVSQVREIHVIFSCNLVILCDRQQVDDALSRATVPLSAGEPCPAGQGRIGRLR